jgi:DNA-binding NtrC family response regulator
MSHSMRLEQTVLLVEDDAHLLASLRRMLRAEPYTLLVASAPSEALGVLASHPVDVLITDQRMPGMSGVEFLSRVRARYPHVVSMMVTGHADVATAIRAINSGEVYRLFTKPCEAGTLAIAIRQALQHKALVFQARRLLDSVRGRPAEPVIYEVDESVDLNALLREIEAELDEAERRNASGSACGETLGGGGL